MARKRDLNALPSLQTQEIEALMADFMAHWAEHDFSIDPATPPPNNKIFSVRLSLPASFQEEETEAALERARATLLYLAYESLPKTARAKMKPPYAEFFIPPTQDYLECRIGNMTKLSDCLQYMTKTAVGVTHGDREARDAAIGAIRSGFEEVKERFATIHGKSATSLIDR